MSLTNEMITYLSDDGDVKGKRRQALKNDFASTRASRSMKSSGNKAKSRKD